jgi:hypothetical protein
LPAPQSPSKQAPLGDETAVTVTINPEARVSAILTGTIPPPPHCGAPLILPVRIVNKGFVTSQLQTRLVADSPAGIALYFDAAPLLGAAMETRELRIVPVSQASADVTIAFYALDDTTTAQSGNSVHLLIRCR